MWQRAHPAWPYVVLVLVVCAFFAPDLFLNRTTMMRDTFADFIPKLSRASGSLLWMQEEGSATFSHSSGKIYASLYCPLVASKHA